MDEITAASDTRPVELVTGPTMTLYRRDVTTSTEKDDKDVDRTVYIYRELRFPTGEYELVRAGMLPPGVTEWTEDLRRIQRSAILDEADKLIAEAEDNIASGSSGQWQEYRDAMRSYKMAVRETASQQGFPQAVTYPEMPVQP